MIYDLYRLTLYRSNGTMIAGVIEGEDISLDSAKDKAHEQLVYENAYKCELECINYDKGQDRYFPEDKIKLYSWYPSEP